MFLSSLGWLLGQTTPREEAGDAATGDATARRAETERVRADVARLRNDPRNLGRVPVLVTRAADAGVDVPALAGTARFLVPPALTVGQLTYALRSRLSLPPETALFLLDAKTGAALPAAARVGELDATLAAADDDGLLRVAYTGEAAFG